MLLFATVLASALVGPAVAQAPGAPMTEGWTLRAVPGGAPVAVASGVGSVQNLAAFCLEGQPWLALVFDARPVGDVIAVSFGFSGGDVVGTAAREAGAGGAYVLALAGSAMTGSLAGSDDRATLSIDGVSQGALSLRGSSRAIGAALAACSAP